MITNDKNLRDVGEMKNRLIIDLFKKNIHETKMDLEQLRGEAFSRCNKISTV